MGTRIGLREVRALQLGTILWDATVIGFGVRRQRSDAAVFFLKCRTRAGRQRWIKIGRFGSPWTPDEARDEARRLLGDIARGDDPAANRTRRGGTTIKQLCDAYLADGKAGKLMKKASTIVTDESRLRKHIIPILGHLPVHAIGRSDIESFLHEVAGKSSKGTAARTTALLGAVFEYAVRNGTLTVNPTRGIKTFAGGKRERRFSDHEYKMLGAALEKAADARIWPAAISATLNEGRCFCHLKRDVGNRNFRQNRGSGLASIICRGRIAVLRLGRAHLCFPKACVGFHLA
jgi:Arm DNA-binding domain/Phage integrase, N-terminal SAM-like domain